MRVSLRKKNGEKSPIYGIFTKNLNLKNITIICVLLYICRWTEI